MAHDWLTLDDLARQLGRDRRELEKLVNRGRLPGKKRDGFWHFHEADVSQWLEGEFKSLTDPELEAIEVGNADPDLNADTPLTDVLKLELVQVPLPGKTKRSVIESLIEVAGRTWQVWEPAAILKAVQDREELCSTALPGGIALPHPRQPSTDSLGDSLVAFGRTASGVPFHAPDGQLTDLFFLILCRETRTHLQVLARLSRMLQKPEFPARLRECETSEEAYKSIAEAEASV